MERLDVVDENGIPTGEVVSRETAHAEGIRHRTSHVWLVRSRGGKTQILLQKRCRQKDSWPGCYDISSAGHIPAGVDFVPSAIRELQEELERKMKPKYLARSRRFRENSVRKAEKRQENQEKGQKES